MKNFLKKRHNQVILAGLFAFFVIIILLNVFHVKQCDNSSCFYESLKTCEKAKFISYSNMTFEYGVLGLENKENCVVNVKLLDAGLNAKDLGIVKNKEMKCYLPYQVVSVPESDISLCHGELKEGFQELLVNKLHTYIIKNLGEINSDLFRI